MEAAGIIKNEGGKNDLIERIAGDKVFDLTLEEIKEMLDPQKFIGRAKEQVEEFLSGEVKKVIDDNKELLGITVDIKV